MESAGFEGVNLDASAGLRVEEEIVKNRIFAGRTTTGLRKLLGLNFSLSVVDWTVVRVLRELKRAYHDRTFVEVYDARALLDIGKVDQPIHLARVDGQGFFSGQIKYSCPRSNLPAYIFADLKLDKGVGEEQYKELHAVLRSGFRGGGYFRDVVPKR